MTVRVTLEHIPINDTANFTQLIAISVHPYKMQNLNGITNSDKMRRINWARHFQNKPYGTLEYLPKIVLDDECVFCSNGSVNTQNVRIWGTERPIQERQALNHSSSLTVWCRISKDKVVGRCFFENGNVIEENYRNMLIHYAFPRFASLRNEYIFHQDGAPSHYSYRVRRYLDNKRPEN